MKSKVSISFTCSNIWGLDDSAVNCPVTVPSDIGDAVVGIITSVDDKNIYGTIWPCVMEPEYYCNADQNVKTKTTAAVYMELVRSKRSEV